MAKIVDAQNITVTAGNAGSQVILDQCSFTVGYGEVLAIIGPNGAGKSTLLKCLAQEIKYQGNIKFNGVSAVAKVRARQVAALPQMSLLNFPFTVNEVVGLARIPHQSGVIVDADIVAEALEAMDIAYLDRRRYTELSGGEKQRVQLARVFAQIWRQQDIGDGLTNRLLLLDEPVNALDLGHQSDLMQAVRKFASQGVAVVMVLHDINLAARYADTILALQCSQQFAYGSVDSVVTKTNMEALFSTKLDITAHKQSGRPIVVQA